MTNVMRRDSRPVVFLNGPPQCGKDTLGEHIVQTCPGFRLVKFAESLKVRTHALYGRPDLPHDAFEKCKDEPNEIFLGLTPRRAYIRVSEGYLKPTHGEDVFGTFLLQKIAKEDSGARAFVISDSGFVPEAQCLLRHFNGDNCILVRIHAEGRGCSFKNDSRGYITLPIESHDIMNNGSREGFLSHASGRLARSLQQMIGGA